MSDSLTVSPTSDPRRVRPADRPILSVPPGRALLPPGGAGLTRRVKAAGPSWTGVEKRGRRGFSQGVWAPGSHITAARAARESGRPTPAYAKRREADVRRREREQAEYEVDFANAVLRFLAFAPVFTAQAKKLAVAVSAHANPLGSGTMARTEPI